MTIAAKHDSAHSTTKSVHPATPRHAEAHLQDGIENLTLRAEKSFHKIAEISNVYSHNIEALFQSGSVASQFYRKLGEQMMKNYRRTVDDFAEFSKEAKTCRKPGSMAALQRKSMEKLSHDYLDMTQKLYGITFDACVEAMQPMADRATSASHRMHDAKAA